MKNTQAFTLIELLVVVLIIGILAAVALPQYQKAVEKSRMVEAIILVKKIAEAQNLFFIANGRYATFEEMDALDIEIPKTGTVNVVGQNRLRTKDFIYTCQGTETGEIALAHRAPAGSRYYIRIVSNNINKIRCVSYTTASSVQKKLCNELNQQGSF